MEIERLIGKLISILERSNKQDSYFTNRYSKMIEELIEMRQAIYEGNYPNNYNAIPLFHYIDRNADDSSIYDKAAEINDWYLSNYRKKDEAVRIREMVKVYLCDDCGLSEKRAQSNIKELAKHKEIYYEFAYYVENRKYKEDAVCIEGYTAKLLHEKFPLSVIGAYNYLVYLVEEPRNALADLKAGLPRK